MNVINQASGANWTLFNGDSCEVLQGLPDASVDLTVFSPPFSSLYTYSPSDRDLGNCKSDAEFFEHFGYITRELRRVLKPGRIACIHVQQLTTTIVTHGVSGMRDFRGDVIRHFQDHGFIYHGEVTIDKCPQAQAIRTKSRALQFVQFNKDSLASRPALADYIILMRVPGDAAAPVVNDVSNDEWIEWARPIWYGIKESDTLNTAVAKDNSDEKHICPLQLGTIERCVRLWSNPGEVVLSPFAGIGSEGYESIRRGRKFVGVELKPQYYQVAVRNLQMAEASVMQPSLFDLAQ
jgi:DNA modification methylase